MSSDGGKRKRQEGDEESEGTNFSNDDINQKKIDEIQLKKKVQNKTRCQRYRDKKKSNAIVDLKISKHQTISLEEEEKIKRRIKLQDKQKSQPCFFNSQDNIQDEIIYDEDGDNDISEQIPIDESLVAQQQTLMWNDEMYLTIAPGE
ncbi:uncharacterized protein TNCV_1475601, partial [Trichonephila clavipes]